jgi:hypothetical protein
VRGFPLSAFPVRGFPLSGEVRGIDPTPLPGGIFEIDAFTNEWLYKSTGPNVPAGDGELIIAVQDLTGGLGAGPKSLLQSTSGNRAIARQLSVGWGIDFDASNDRYVIQDSGIPAATFINVTYYKVLTLDSLTSRTVMSSSTGGAGAFQDRYSNPQILKNDIEVVATATSAPSTGVRIVDAMTYDGATVNFYRNGVLNGSTSIVKTFNNPSNLFGATTTGLELFDGLVHYCKVFTSVHSLQTIQGVTTYLRNRWGV